MRTSHKTVTFQRPFTIAGVDGIQPAGTYAVVTEEEEVPGISFTAWRRVETTLRLPALDFPSGQEQVIAINPQALAKALAADSDATVQGDQTFPLPNSEERN